MFERKVDSLGRITIPAQLKRKLNIKTDTIISEREEDGRIIIEVVSASCIFCGDNIDDRLITYAGKKICINCLERLKVIKDMRY